MIRGYLRNGGRGMREYCRILVVEDEFIMRQGIKHLADWESKGFQVVGEACDGKQALEMVKSLHPHIVLTDVVMPEMDGIELTRILTENYPDIQVVVLSSYSDFEYVKSTFQNGAVDYILKPTLNPTDLLKTLEKAAAKVPNLVLTSSKGISLERQVNQLLSGYSNEEVKTLADFFPYDGFFLLGMNVPYVFGATEGAMTRQIRLLSQEMKKTLKEYTTVQVITDEQILLCVVNFPSNENLRARELLRQSVSHISKESPEAFYVCSPQFSSVEQMREIYTQGFIKFTQQRFYHKEEALLYASIEAPAAPMEKFDFSHYNDLIRMLQIRDGLKMLREYMNTAIEKQAMEEYEIKALAQNALYQLISLLEELHFNQESLENLKRDYFLKISDAKFVEDFRMAIALILQDFEQIVQKYQIESSSRTMKEILDYISENYSEPLTLHDLADRFNFNYYYLSSYFSVHNKEGFSEYLNKERIKKAKELLSRGDVTVSQVYGAVGYSDHSYFCKVFKKFTGSTPSEFKKKCTSSISSDNGEEA